MTEHQGNLTRVFQEGTRHLVLLAHQDDELPYAGLLQRMHEPQVVFLTNGDGLHFELDMEPEPYAALRRAESEQGLARLGISGEQTTFMGWSELTFYAAFGEMSAKRSLPRIPHVFEEAYQGVQEIVMEQAPDVIWTLAWQGGNPEHDLMNLYARRAARKLEVETGKNLRFFELPAYELLVLVMRFGRWYDGLQHRITLNEEELAAKRDLLGMYPTQERVIRELSRAIKARGLLERVRGRNYSFDDFGRVEVFGEPPLGRDPRRSTHRFPRLDYPFDDWKGQRIRFERTLARLGEAWYPSLR